MLKRRENIPFTISKSIIVAVCWALELWPAKFNIGTVRRNSEPRWAAGIAVVAMGGLLALAPSLLAIVLVMMVRPPSTELVIIL